MVVTDDNGYQTSFCPVAACGCLDGVCFIYDIMQDTPTAQCMHGFVQFSVPDSLVAHVRCFGCIDLFTTSSVL